MVRHYHTILSAELTYLVSFVADDTAMFYGLKYYNDLLMQAGPQGNVQSEVLLQKNQDMFSLKQGWAFPRRVYFNGDECMLPPPDTYPFLPNSGRILLPTFSTVVAFLLLLVINDIFLYYNMGN